VTSTDGVRYCYRHPDRETGLSCSECGRPICYECMTAAPVGLRCPEHSGKPQGVAKVTRAAERAVTGVGGRRVNAVTLALIGINLAVYLAELGAGGTINGTSNWLFDHGASILSGVYAQGQVVPVPEGVVVPRGIELIGFAHGEWWRIFTPMFLHYGPLHLALNMYSLYFAGSILESIIGRWRFLLLYVVSGLAGSAGAFLWSPNSIGVGASGAIFGVLGALFVLERRGNISTGGQIAGLILINLVFTFALSRFVSVGAHVGGLIGGIVVMFLMLRANRSALIAVGAAAAVTVVSLVLSFWQARGYA
jgi:membrane associated rhomboid family serine protease